MNSTMNKPSKGEAMSDFFLATKVGYTIFIVLTVLFVGVIPAILLSMAP